MLITGFEIKGMNKVAADIAAGFKSGHVEVGFFAGDNTTKLGTDYADIAEKNNYGDPMNMMNGKPAPIPPRPFIDATIDEFKESVGGGDERMEDLETRIVVGAKLDRRLNTKQYLEEMGRFFLNRMLLICARWTTPPNDPITIAAKGRDDPLVWNKNLASYARAKKPVVK